MMKLLIVLCAVVALSQAGYLSAPSAVAVRAAYAAPGVVAAAPTAYAAYGAPAAYAAHLGYAGLATPYAAHLGYAGLATPYAAHLGYAAPAVVAAVPHSDHIVNTLSVGGPAGLALTPAGTPVDTPAVQAARVADAVAHVNAKATTLLG